MESGLGPVGALAGAVLVWGTTFVVSDAALSSLSPALLTVARFALALVVLVPLAMRRGGLAEAAKCRPVALLGATGVAAYYGLQNLGLTTTDAGTAAVLQVVLPLATALLAVVFLRERLSAALVAGMMLATVGIALVAGGVLAQASAGAGLIALGVLAYAVYTVLLRREPERDPVVLAAATCGWGLAFLLPWLVGELALGEARCDPSAEALASLVYLGLAASALTLLLWTYGASRVPASTAGVFTASIPAVGYLCAVVAGDAASWARTAGSALSLAGAVVAASAARTPRRSRMTTRRRPSARGRAPSMTGSPPLDG